MVEKAKGKELFKENFHPYTKALISAIPRIKKTEEHKRIILKGELSSPINPPNACRFAVRCNYARDICRRQMPELIEIKKGRYVACHLAKEINNIS